MSRNDVYAGTRVTYTWPVTVASGSVDAIDAVVLVCRPDGTIIDEIAATATASVDPLVGVISAEVEWPDTLERGAYIVRLDCDDSAGDLAADQVTVHVQAAIAQRT